MNSLDVETTRRLSIGLMAVSGGLLFSALNLIGAGVSGNNLAFAAGVSRSLSPLVLSAGVGLIALFWAEMAAHPSTPQTGHPHSVNNYLQSAFAILVVTGLGALVYGVVVLVSAATIKAPSS